MANYRTLRLKRGGTKSDAVDATLADTTSLATALAGDGILLVVDQSQVKSSVAISAMMKLLQNTMAVSSGSWNVP